MAKKGPLWWRESDWLLRGSSAANQILLRHSGPILSGVIHFSCLRTFKTLITGRLCFHRRLSVHGGGGRYIACFKSSSHQGKGGILSSPLDIRHGHLPTHLHLSIDIWWSSLQTCSNVFT